MDIRIRGSRDGVETALFLHERWGAAVILLTAYADEATIARAKLTQPFGYILKPFEERELRTAIEIGLYRAGMEKKLRSSEERFRRLFEEGLSGNFLADLEGGIMEANPVFRRLFGIGSASTQAALPDFPSLFPNAVAWQSFRKGLSISGRLENVELSMKRLDGAELLISANAALMLDEKGEPRCIQGELSDLTEKRKLEQRLSQAQRMEAVGRLAGGIAHDFNNILTAVMGYANLLTEELGPESPCADDLEGIKKAAGKASALTRQLLAFSRRQPVSPRVLDTNAIVTDLEKMLRRVLSESISFGLALDPDTPPILADASQIEQVLLNLVVNARDAMPSGGRLLVSTQREKLRSSRNVGIDTLAPGDYAVITVLDSGKGIDPGIIDRIFEPFFTTKDEGKGTGLGLAMVYGIAKQAGGGVEVASPPGAGAKFKVWIPAAPARSESDAEASREAELPAAESASILFVDDDEEIRAIAERILGRAGHRVLVAGNAGEAILIAESQGNPVDLLITDIVMPIMDGYHLAKRLRTILPGLKVLYLSGYADMEGRGAEDFKLLSKPFSESDLVRAVSRALAERKPAEGIGGASG
jgi:PAS domain S-box-containing protein